MTIASNNINSNFFFLKKVKITLQSKHISSYVEIFVTEQLVIKLLAKV